MEDFTPYPPCERGCDACSFYDSVPWNNHPGFSVCSVCETRPRLYLTTKCVDCQHLDVISGE